MIKKFNKVDAGVFHNFHWNSGTSDIPEFKKISIVYGQNYSGKTTLSRIVRSFEVHHLPIGLTSATFSLQTDYGELTEQDISNNDSEFIPRVFNEDFVRENISFFEDNDTPHSKAFTVIGARNVSIEHEIRELEKELGSDTENAETGLYKDRIQCNEAYTTIKRTYEENKKSLDQSITNAATEIRGNQADYGRIVLNYKAPNLRTDIDFVLSPKYRQPTYDEIRILKSKVAETTKPQVSPFKNLGDDFPEILSRVQNACSRKIGYSKEILDLVHQELLEGWVREGIKLNKDRHRCAFCGQPITQERWTALFQHFNEDSEKLTGV